MPVSAFEPDPPAITTSWEAELERRIAALQARYAPDAGDRRRQRTPGGSVPAAVRRAAAAVGVQVLEYRAGAIGMVTVRCPHCGGPRRVSSSGLRGWEVRRLVPACGGPRSTCVQEGFAHG